MTARLMRYDSTPNVHISNIGTPLTDFVTPFAAPASGGSPLPFPSQGDTSGWDGTYLYALKSSAGIKQLVRLDPINGPFTWSSPLAGGVSLGNPATDQRCSFAFDGTYIYIYTSNAFYSYYPGTDQLFNLPNLDPTAKYNDPTLYWDGGDNIYMRPSGNRTATLASNNGFSRYSIPTGTVITNGTSSGATSGLLKSLAVWYDPSTSKHIMLTLSTSNNGLAIYMGTDAGTNIAFTSGGGLTWGGTYASNLSSGTWIASGTILIISDSLLWQINYNPANGNVTSASNLGGVSPFGGISSMYDFVPLAVLTNSSGTPIAISQVMNSIPLAPNFPSSAFSVYAKVLTNTSHIYVKSVQGYTLGPYVQFSASPSGPWTSSIDLGAGLVGQVLPFYFRVYPPVIMPTTYAFAISFGINP